MDLGYVTHAVHANSRLVRLESSLAGDMKTLSFIAPPNGNIYPPGPGWLYIVVNDTPSTGIKVMIGDGKSPDTNDSALKKYALALIHRLPALIKPTLQSSLVDQRGPI